MSLFKVLVVINHSMSRLTSPISSVGFIHNITVYRSVYVGFTTIFDKTDHFQLVTPCIHSGSGSVANSKVN